MQLNAITFVGSRERKVGTRVTLKISVATDKRHETHPVTCVWCRVNMKSWSFKSRRSPLVRRGAKTLWLCRWFEANDLVCL